jgi:hypothetical protein
MFKQHDVVTEEDVGNFIHELHNSTKQPIDEVLNREVIPMVRDSEKPTTRS